MLTSEQDFKNTIQKLRIYYGKQLLPLSFPERNRITSHLTLLETNYIQENKTKASTIKIYVLCIIRTKSNERINSKITYIIREVYYSPLNIGSLFEISFTHSLVLIEKRKNAIIS